MLPRKTWLYHVASPCAGLPLKAITTALNGTASREIPTSFDKLHPSSRVKYRWESDLIGTLESPIPENRVHELIQIGAIWVHILNSAGVAVLHRLKLEDLTTRWISKGTYIKAYLNPKRYPNIAMNDRIVNNDEHFVIVDKPSGVPSIPHTDNFIENALAATQQAACVNYLWPCHRLDISTSGLLVYAKTKEACSGFGKLLLKSKVKKSYILNAKRASPASPPIPQPGSIIKHYMQCSKRAPQLTSDTQSDTFAYAALLQIIEKQELSTDLIKVKVLLMTGRTHQIRAQFSALGWPLEGDYLYGSDCSKTILDPYNSPDVSLRCYEISFSYAGKIYRFNVEN